MKRTLSIVLLISMLFCAGCGANQFANEQQGASVKPTEDDSFYVYDYDGALGNVGYNCTIAETEHSIYILDDELIWVSDKEYKCFMPLCQRPDCRHKDENCSAYIPGCTAFYLYGKWLYYIVNEYVFSDSGLFPELWRMQLDGSAHEKVMDIPLPIERDETKLYNVRASAFVTNKYLVLFTGAVKQAQSLDDDEIISKRSYFSLDLETLDYCKIAISPLGGVIPQNLHPLAGNGVLLYAHLFNYGTDDPRIIIEIELDSGAVRELYAHHEGFDFNYRSFCLLDDVLYIALDDRSDSSEGMRTLYGLSVITGELAEICKEPITQPRWMTFDKNSGYNYGFIMRTDDPAIKGIYINDLELNQLEFLPASEQPEETHEELLIDYITSDYIFAVCKTKSEGSYVYARMAGVPTWYLDKSEIGTGHMQWRKWEP